MSTATTTNPTTTAHHTLWTYAGLLLVALTLIAGIFVASRSTSSEAPAVADPVTASVVDGGSAACTHRFELGGGVLEGDSSSDRCGSGGGEVRRGGVQP